jgi:hypothetical protein
MVLCLDLLHFEGPKTSKCKSYQWLLCEIFLRLQTTNRTQSLHESRPAPNAHAAQVALGLPQLAHTLLPRQGVDVAERAAVRSAHVVQHQRDALRLQSEREARRRHMHSVALLLHKRPLEQLSE